MFNGDFCGEAGACHPGRRQLVTASVVVALLLGGCATDKATVTQGTMNELPAATERVIALAEQAVEQRRHDDARALVQRVLLRERDNVHARILWGELLLASGAADAAIPYFDPYSDHLAFGARAQQGRGLALIRIGEIEQAKSELENAVENDPTLWRAWNGLGYCYDRLANWNRASRAYDNAIAANRDSATVFNNRGYSRLLQRRVDEAAEDFARALHIDPGLKIAESNLRLAIAWSGQYQRAVNGADAQELRRILNNVGFVAMLKGDFAAAESLLLRAVEADAAYNVTAHRNLSYLRSLKEAGKNEDKK